MRWVLVWSCGGGRWWFWAVWWFWFWTGGGGEGWDGAWFGLVRWGLILQCGRDGAWGCLVQRDLGHEVQGLDRWMVVLEWRWSRWGGRGLKVFD